MGHVSLVPHEPLGAVIAAEGEVSSVAALVANQFISVTELFLTIVTGVSKLGLLTSDTSHDSSDIHLFVLL